MENITLGQIAVIITFIVSFIGGLEFLFIRINKSLNKKISEITDEHNKNQNEALKCLLRSQITSKYYVYKELGEVPEYERANVTYMREQYKNMGGNSYIDTIYEEFMKLPIKK